MPAKRRTEALVSASRFGRIGRLVLKAGLKNKNLDFIAVNDLTDAKTSAHLFKYDSIHRRFNGTVVVENDQLVINGKKIKILFYLKIKKEKKKNPRNAQMFYTSFTDPFHKFCYSFC